MSEAGRTGGGGSSGGGSLLFWAPFHSIVAPTPTDRGGAEIRGLNMWLEIGDVGERERSTQPHPSSLLPPGINRA